MHKPINSYILAWAGNICFMYIANLACFRLIKNRKCFGKKASFIRKYVFYLNLEKSAGFGGRFGVASVRI